MKPYASTLLALFSLCGPTSAESAMSQTTNSDELQSTMDDQQAVAVTIYNENLALIKDQRRVDLPAGELRLAFRDVSAKIQPETALLRSLDAGPGLEVIEQNFDFDLLTPQKLLEKYIGKGVGVIKTHPTTGEETEEDATVLAATGGAVLRVGDRIETGIPGRIVFREVPANLRDRPTLVMHLENPEAGPREVELSYLTQGLSWKADYVGELDSEDKSLDLTGWVTLDNKSGVRFENALLQLVAGDVHRVADAMPPMAADFGRAMVMAPGPMAQEALFEYHLYTLGRPTTIADNQSKQVSLLTATGVPADKELLLVGSAHYYQRSQGDLGNKLKVGVFLEFANREESNLGMPLPKGVVRLYKKDAKGNAQFVGEDRIDHTPKQEKVRLKLGDAFDVTANKKQTDFQKLSGFGPWNYQYESAYEIEIKNAKLEPVVVRVQEPIPGDWEIREESSPHEKGDAHTAVWNLQVPAEGETRLTYRVRARF